MRRFLALGAFGLVLTVAGLATTSVGAKQPTAEEQVVVLLKWYHTYLENGKYQQAIEIAETAHALAPDDPQTMAALKVSHHQRTSAANKERADLRMEKLLTRLEQLEQHVRELENHKSSLEKQVRDLKTRNERLNRGSQPPRREPLGSPDRID